MIPNNEVTFSEGEMWSNNLLNLIGGGFVRQIDIYGIPGVKIYAGPQISTSEDIGNKYLILGPSGRFNMSLEDGFLLNDIRISKESYDLCTSGIGGYVAFNIISSYAPSQATSRIVIYNGGGVSENVE